MADKQSTTTTTTEFQFVNATIDAPTIPQDLAIRALIRKQAMKKASAARRRDGNYGKHNLRQYPVFLFDQPNTATGTVDICHEAEQTWAPVEAVREKPVLRIATAGAPIGPVRPREVKTKPKPKRREIQVPQQLGSGGTGAESIPMGLSARGYELTSMKSDFDILDLSTLATLHVGRAARGALSRNPYHLISQLRSYKQWSYLSFLPSLYGQIPCLSDATDCVIARARQIISPNRKWEAAVITFYVKALDSLQKALDAPNQRFKPEVLCATEILSLYELLDPAGETAWIRHAAGAARLIQLRGPKNYNTEFEKALFMAHTGPIMTEALLNNERCFLEQPPWKAVFRSIIREDALLSDRSSIVITLMILKSNIPGLFVDVTNILYFPSSPSTPSIPTITTHLTYLRIDLYHWHTEYHALLSSHPPIRPGTPEYDRHCKVYATYLSCQIIVSRLLGALSAPDRPDLEDETQLLAHQMLDMEIEVKGADSAAGMFMAQTLGVSQATIASSPDWMGGSGGSVRSTSCSLAPSLLSEESWKGSYITSASEANGNGEVNDNPNLNTDDPNQETISPSSFFLPSGPPSATLSDDPPSAGLSSSGFSLGTGGEVSTAPSSENGSGVGMPVGGGMTGGEGLIEKWRFEGWCRRFGRKMPYS